jgi:hypothetical protein
VQLSVVQSWKSFCINIQVSGERGVLCIWIISLVPSAVVLLFETKTIEQVRLSMDVQSVSGKGSR